MSTAKHLSEVGGLDSHLSDWTGRLFSILSAMHVLGSTCVHWCGKGGGRDRGEDTSRAQQGPGPGSHTVGEEELQIC